MSLQKTINKYQPLGIPGQFYDATLRRATAYNPGPDGLDSEHFGRVLTFDAAGEPQIGGEGKFAGILLHPHAYARTGLEGVGAVLQGGTIELADVGRIVVLSTAAAAPQDKVQYDTATGEITGVAPASPGAGMAVLPDAEFILFDAEADGLAVIQLGINFKEV